MNAFVLSLLMAAPQSAEGAQPGPMGGLGAFIPFILIIGIFYFLLIRPQNKKQKETQKMIAALKKGDRIVTIGGIHGIVQSVKEQSVIVKVDDDTKIEFSRNAISSVETAAKVKEAEKAETSEAEDENEEK